MLGLLLKNSIIKKDVFTCKLIKISKKALIFLVNHDADSCLKQYYWWHNSILPHIAPMLMLSTATQAGGELCNFMILHRGFWPFDRHKLWDRWPPSNSLNFGVGDATPMLRNQENNLFQHECTLHNQPQTSFIILLNFVQAQILDNAWRITYRLVTNHTKISLKVEKTL